MTSYAVNSKVDGALIYIKDSLLANRTQEVIRLVNARDQAMLGVAFNLAIVKQFSLYTHDGFDSVYDYAKHILGYKRTMTSNLISVGRMFVEKTKYGYQSVFHHPRYDYNYSQLVELVPIGLKRAKELDKEQKITPDMKVKELKKVVSSERQ